MILLAYIKMRVLRKMSLQYNPISSRPLEIGEIEFVYYSLATRASILSNFFAPARRLPHEGFIIYLREDVF